MLQTKRTTRCFLILVACCLTTACATFSGPPPGPTKPPCDPPPIPEELLDPQACPKPPIPQDGQFGTIYQDDLATKNLYWECKVKRDRLADLVRRDQDWCRRQNQNPQADPQAANKAWWQWW